MKARELYREIARERMNTLGTDLPDYSLWSQDFKPDEMANLLKLLCENFEKDLDIWWNKICSLKKEVRTPGNEAETWDSGLNSLGPVHLDIKQDSSSIWGCQTPTPINASTGCLWNQPLWTFLQHFFDLKEYRQQNIIVYLCLYWLFWDRQTHTLNMNNVSKSFPERHGDELFFWGGGAVGSYVLTFEDSGNANKIGVIQQDMQPHLFCNLFNFPLSIKEMNSSRERSSFSCALSAFWIQLFYSFCCSLR